MKTLIKVLLYTLILGAMPAVFIGSLFTDSVQDYPKNIQSLESRIEDSEYTKKLNLQKQLSEAKSDQNWAYFGASLFITAILFVPLGKSIRLVIFYTKSQSATLHWISNMEQLGLLRACYKEKFLGISILNPYNFSNVNKIPPFKTEYYLATNDNESIIIDRPQARPFFPIRDAVIIENFDRKFIGSKHYFPFLMVSWSRDEQTARQRRVDSLSSDFKIGSKHRRTALNPKREEDGIEYAEVIDEDNVRLPRHRGW